jgi:hypothetical protein
MLTTCFEGGLRPRPLDARPDRSAGIIFFIIDARGLKNDEVKARPDVCFTVIDTEQRAYPSITGHATMSRYKGHLRASRIEHGSVASMARFSKREVLIGVAIDGSDMARRSECLRNWPGSDFSSVVTTWERPAS